MIKVGDLVTDVFILPSTAEKVSFGVVLKIMESKAGSIVAYRVKWIHPEFLSPLWHKPGRLEKISG